MSFIYSNNTRAGLEKIKKDLIKAGMVVSCISIVVFTLYYSYLIYKNITKPLYLVVYSILFLGVVATFIVEMILKESKGKTKKQKRIITERKRKLNNAIKIVKYLMKAILVGVAMYETIVDFNLNLSNLLNVLSAVWLAIQIILDIVILYIIYCVDYLTLCIEKDAEKSGIAKAIKFFRNGKEKKNEKLEKEAFAIMGESKYTEQQEEMLKLIEERKVEFEEEREQELDANIQRNRSIIDRFKNTLKPKKKKSK